MDDHITAQIMGNYEKLLIPKLGQSLRDDLLMLLEKYARKAETQEDLLNDYHKDVLAQRFGKRWAGTLYKNLEKVLEGIDMTPAEDDCPPKAY
jgi:hypothetical protein